MYCGHGNIRRVIKNIERATSYGKKWRKHSKPKRKLAAKERIPLLIKQMSLSIRQRDRDLALRDLVYLTGRNFGYDTVDWMTWYERNKDGDRDSWTLETLERAGYDPHHESTANLIPRLIGALRHTRSGVRAAAYYFLRKLTDRDFPFPILAGRPSRERHVLQWVSWWDTQGERAFLREAQ